jgi:hypothetical protein
MSDVACLHAQALPVSAVHVLPSGFFCTGARVPNGPHLSALCCCSSGGAILHTHALPVSAVQVLPSGFFCTGARVPKGPHLSDEAAKTAGIPIARMRKAVGFMMAGRM